MNTNHKEKISTGSASLFQLIILSAMVSFSLCFLIAAIILGSFEVWGTFLLVFPVPLFISWGSLRFADIYLVGDRVRYQNIIKTKSRPITDIKAIDEGSHYNNYFLEFTDGERVHFQVKKRYGLKWPNHNDRSNMIAFLRQRFNAKPPKWLQPPNSVEH